MSTDLSRKPAIGLTGHPDDEAERACREVPHGDPVALLDRSRYAALRTFRPSGEPVDTAVWFVRQGDRVWFRTPRDAAKLRRLVAEPGVELRPCSWKGENLGAPVRGTARVLSPTASVVPERLLAGRYGWQWNVLPLVRLPGTNTVRHGGTWREKWHLARATTLWQGSVIVEVTLDRSALRRRQPEQPDP